MVRPRHTPPSMHAKAASQAVVCVGREANLIPSAKPGDKQTSRTPSDCNAWWRSCSAENKTMMTSDNGEVKGFQSPCTGDSQTTSRETWLSKLDDEPGQPMRGERATKALVFALGAGLLVYLLATGDWSALASTALGALASDAGRAAR